MREGERLLEDRSYWSSKPGISEQEKCLMAVSLAF